MKRFKKGTQTISLIQPNIIISGGKRHISGYTLTNADRRTKIIPTGEKHDTCASVVLEVSPSVRGMFTKSKNGAGGMRVGVKKLVDAVKGLVEVQTLTREEAVELCQQRGGVKGLTFYDGLGNQMFPTVRMDDNACEMFTNEKVWDTFKENHIQIFTRNKFVE